MNVEALRNRLNNYPRLSFTNSPTPIQPLVQFQKSINSETSPSIWIKRDDEIGPGLGGNKGRKLEFLMAEALALKKKKVVTFGGLQSNHARMTAAASAALGLDAHIFYFDRKPQKFTGNLLLNDIFGATLHFVPFGGGSSGALSLEKTNHLVRLLSWPFVGFGSYFIPVGGHSVTGCLGYVNAACEFVEQLNRMGLSHNKTTIVTAAGTGGTLAGLLAGFKILQSPISILGIDIGSLWRGFSNSIARLTTDLCTSLGQKIFFKAEDVTLIEKTYVGKAYAHPTEAGLNAIRLLARTEGIILDPVYTGKALAGMIDLIKRGYFADKQHVIFLHSGGFPALDTMSEQFF